MKTLYTTLPFYDRLAKQCYQRSNRTGEIYPIKSPRHRLPSFLINTESDNPGEIKNVYIYDKNGSNFEVPIFSNWANDIGGAPFDTFNTEGLNIISAIKIAAASATATARYRVLGTVQDVMTVEAGDTIRVTGTFTKNSGVGNANIRFYISTITGMAMDGAQIDLSTGTINATHTFATGGIIWVVICTASTINFSFINVIFTINTLSHNFNTTVSYIQSWANSPTIPYDSFTLADTTVIIQKTVAAGAQSCWNTFSIESVPESLTTGDCIRIRAYLLLNSGSPPRMFLQNTGTMAVISNIVILTAGDNYFYLVATATVASGWAITIYNADTELTNFRIYFGYGEKTYLPKLYTTLTNDYFQYNGEILGSLLPCGTYYLKITTVNSYVYYSEMITVTDIYNNLISELTNIDYDTFISFETKTFSAINIAGTATCISNIFNVIKGEQIKIIFFLTLNSGANPYARIHGLIESVYQVSSIGLNEITLTITWSGIAQFLFHNEAASNFSTSEILVIRQYSEKYLTINFSNSCDIGDLLYATGFEQTVYIESETMETTFPQEEEGQKNGEGKFIRTFARQVKKYNVKAGAFPDYMIDVFNRMRLHDTIELIDIVGNENDLYNLEVENEWLPPGKYYANISLTFDYDEAVVVSSCCVNLT